MIPVLGQTLLRPERLATGAPSTECPKAMSSVIEPMQSVHREAAERPALLSRLRGSAGLIIAFSGLDCSGKSTQIALLCEKFGAEGYSPVRRWIRVGYTPGMCILKAAIRRITGGDKLPPGDSPQRARFMKSSWKSRLWLYCAFADLLFETALRMRYLRLRSRAVIADRYLADSEIDLILHFGPRTTHMWSWKLVRYAAIRPDAHILLDLPFSESLRRSMLKQEPFPDSEARRRDRSTLYNQFKSSTDWTVIDGCMSVRDIAHAVDALL